MKQILTAVFLLIFSWGFSQRITVPSNYGEWYYPDLIQTNGLYERKFPAKPGDTVLVDAEYTHIGLYNLHGQPGKPIVFLRVGGKARVGKNNLGNAMITARCSYLVFDGFEVGHDNPDGKSYSAQGWNIQSSHNIEIKNFIVKNANIGFFTNPADGHYPNLYFHDGEVRSIRDKNNSNFDEAFYIGRTSGQSLAVNTFANLRIENVNLYDLGGDGFQLANCVNFSVKNCRVYRAGLNKINDQWFAYLCGGNSSGTFENVYAEDCSGTPFQVLGTDKVRFINAVAKNCGFGAANQDAFYLRQSGAALTVEIKNCKVDRKSRSWVFLASPTIKLDTAGNIFGGPVTGDSTPVIIPTAPVDSVTKASFDSLQALYNTAQMMYAGCNNNLQTLQTNYNNVLANLNAANQQYEELKARYEAFKKELQNLINKF